MTYELLDSGNGKRLEKIGGGLFIRPAFYAVWPARLSSSFWKRAGFEFQGQSDGGKGRWVRHSPPSRSIFFIEYSGFHFECRLTDYGHVGVFFEQKDQWAWLEKNTYSGAQYLNLFAYTGGSTFAAAKKAAVTHVDSSGSVLSWAKKNADLSGVRSEAIRWIQDDAMSFILREKKRKHLYDGIIADPPSFGRGTKGEIWQIEKNLMPFLFACRDILKPDPHFFLLSAHSPGFSKQVLHHCLAELFPGSLNHIESGEMLIPEQTGRLFPAGTFARWKK